MREAQQTAGGLRRNIRLLIAYDGTDFAGWQRQKGLRTVQGEIEAALEKLHGKKVALTGSGRTDAGVHAAGQVANFYTGIQSIGADRFVPALNSLLPQDIRVLESAGAADDFHSRFDAKRRTYRYRFVCGRQGLPHETRYSLQLWRRPRIDLLNDYCRLLLGERDCSAFASAGDSSRSRNRYLFQACFFPEGDGLVFEISANAFLWKMVRTVAGTLLRCEEQGLGTEEFAEVLASGRRNAAGPCLPPRGLFLWKIDYYREGGAL
ncbi:MAG: tRNA pseudouridine(38-40) synthase TruA [Treponema sp.]|jgi:tRNA pseudouridine38-40 synthase|nr:tRNA pseudouridine(38-40) synthase TruA [Treponema sp.]